MGLSGNDLVIKGLIELQLQGKGAAEAKAAMRDIVANSKAAASEIQKPIDKVNALDSAVGRLGATMVATFGAAAVTQFVKTSVLEFARLERQLGAVQAQMQRLGFGSEFEAIKAQLEGLGFEKLEETIPAFQKFLTITKDVTAAMAAVRLAVDASEAGIGKIGETAGGVANLLQGRAVGAAQLFGLELVKLDGTVKSNDELMRELSTTYAGFTERAADSQEQIDSLAASWAKLKSEVGGFVSPILGALVEGLDRVKNTAASAWAVLARGFDIRGLVAAGKQGPDAIVAFLIQDLPQIWAKAGAASGAAYAEGLSKLTEQAHRKTVDDASKAAKEAADKLAGEIRTITDAYQAEAFRMVEIQAQADARMEQETVDATRRRLEAIADAQEEGSTARIEAELDLFDFVAAQELAKLGENYEAKKELEIAFQIARQEIIRKANEDVVKADEESNAERLKNEEKYKKAIAQLEREIAAAKVQTSIEVFSALADAARTEFGRHKGAARASVILDTAAAIMSIWAGSGPWYIKAIKTAAVAHAGRMQLEAINSTTYDGGGSISGAGAGGGGSQQSTQQDMSFSNAGIVSSTSSGSLKSGSFDDPINDRMAFAMGRRSAFDLASHFSRGFETGARDMVGGPTTYDQSDRRTITVNVQGLYGGRRGLQDLRRELARAEERDRARRLG